MFSDHSLHACDLRGRHRCTTLGAGSRFNPEPNRLRFLRQAVSIVGELVPYLLVDGASVGLSRSASILWIDPGNILELARDSGWASKSQVIKVRLASMQCAEDLTQLLDWPGRSVVGSADLEIERERENEFLSVPGWRANRHGTRPNASSGGRPARVSSG